MTKYTLFLWAIGASLATPAALADDAARVLECAEVEDDERRLECYDRVAADDDAGAAPETTPSAAAPAAATAPGNARHPAPTEPVATAEDRFGLDAEREADDREDEPDQISARITHIEARRHGERIFTLDNGQIWVEDSPNPSLRLDAGDTVTIKSGLFGSQRLYGSGNRSSRVDRVR